MRSKTRIVLVITASAVLHAAVISRAEIGLARAEPQSKPNQLGQVEFISAEELKAKIAKNEQLSIVDLRAQGSFEQSDKTIKGSFHSRVRKVVYQLRQRPRDWEIITYCACAADEAAIIAAQKLQASGFKRVRVLKGGWNAWLQAGGQLATKARL